MGAMGAGCLVKLNREGRDEVSLSSSGIFVLRFGYYLC